MKAPDGIPVHELLLTTDRNGNPMLRLGPAGSEEARTFKGHEEIVNVMHSLIATGKAAWREIEGREGRG